MRLLLVMMLLLPVPAFGWQSSVSDSGAARVRLLTPDGYAMEVECANAHLEVRVPMPDGRIYPSGNVIIGRDTVEREEVWPTIRWRRVLALSNAEAFRFVQGLREVRVLTVRDARMTEAWRFPVNGAEPAQRLASECLRAAERAGIVR